jgi:transposase
VPREEKVFVLHVGLDLSRKRVDVCLISDQGELIDRLAATPDRDGLHGLARRVAVHGEPVRAVVESMNGARFVHDELVSHGWEVLVADAQKVKGLAPLACKTDKIDSRCWASCRSGIWCRRSGCPRSSCAQSGRSPGGGCIWSSTAPP